MASNLYPKISNKCYCMGKKVLLLIGLNKKYKFCFQNFQINNLAVFIDYMSRVFAGALCMTIQYFVKHIWSQKQEYVSLTEVYFNNR